MADEASQERRLIEGLIQQQLDAAAAQRGWDLGAQAQGAQLSTSGAGLATQSAADFSTGYNGSETVLAFTFDFSLLDGPDMLL